MIVVAMLFGCSEGEGPSYHRDVAPIIDGRCVSCHQSGGIGPFVLDSYAAVSEVGEIVASVVETRQMPPWKAVAGHRDYANDASLTDLQIATIVDWVEAGMPEGDPADTGEPLPVVAVKLPQVDRTLSMPEPYLPGGGADDYRCFLLDWEGPPTTYVTGFDVRPGNDTVVHHVAVFLVRPDGITGPGVLDTFHEWDAEEAGPGYGCFGGPSKTGANLQVPVQQVAQWVPGTGATVFPAGVGIPVPDGSLLVLQMHYNTLTGDGNPDNTTFDLMLADDVQRVGAFAPWLDASWTFGTMVLPPGQKTTHTAAGSPFSFFDILMGDDIDLSNGFDIHGVMLHMHNLGQRSLVKTMPAAGAEQILVEVDDYDFNWQLTYNFVEAVAFGPDDEIHLECTFDNVTEATVNWGEGTGEEMCVANLLVSAPK